MAVYNDAMCKKCRALGSKLFLKGEKCFTDKCAFEKKPYPPGKNRISRRRKSSYYSHLIEKQKAKILYGILERQFRKYFFKAKMQRGETGENLIKLLERRLDNVLFRSGMASSRKEARRLISHGHIIVNGRKVNIPSYILKKSDVVSFSKKTKEREDIKQTFSERVKRGISPWIVADLDKLNITFSDIPNKEDIQPPFSANAIVELYSK